MPPIIGITQATTLHQPLSLRDILFRNAYYCAIRQAGGIPTKLIYPDKDFAPSSDLKNFGGILFTGGDDLNPKTYGTVSDNLTRGIDDQRDAFELSLFKYVMENDIPFLGICRGVQLVNVALGGSLFHDLKTERPSNDEHDWFPSRQYLPHSVGLRQDCRLIRLGYPTNTMVNSLHHQGIRELGAHLMPTGYASDGLIESVELTGHRFGLAVQWHPEWLTDQQPARALFESFIKACE